MTLKQLQAELRPKQADRKYWTGDDHTQNACADALTPFILQQNKDLELMRELMESLRIARGFELGEEESELVDLASSRLNEME